MGHGVLKTLKRLRYTAMRITVFMGVVSLCAESAEQKIPAEPGTLLPTVLGPVDTLCRVTHHRIIIDGKELRYTATAGRLAVGDTAGHPTAFIFFTSYEREPGGAPDNRPITFAFNGGPGASSMWLHLGAAGPWRALFGGDGTELPAIDSLVVNNRTWLPFTDLVFVDPVGTGYSRAAPGDDPDKFFTVNSDVRIMAQFLQNYLSRYERWPSPKFIAGESYGATRAAGLSEYLQSAMNMAIDGVILISSALDFQTISFEPGNDLAYVLALPSYTAAAWYHKRLRPDFQEIGLEQCVSAAEQWTLKSYLPRLFRGTAPTQQPDSGGFDSLAVFSGLSPLYIREREQRVDAFGFASHLIADQLAMVGILDSRIVTGATSRGSRYGYTDPSLFIPAGPLTALINDYLRKDLAYASPLEYVAFSNEVNRKWRWSESSGQGYVNMIPSLRNAMSINGRLRLFAAMGYFDLATPYLSQRYALEHIGGDSAVRSRITSVCYPAGYQIYTHIPSLDRLTADVEAFVAHKQ